MSLKDTLRLIKSVLDKIFKFACDTGGQIFATTNYGAFAYVEGNRPVNSAHVAQLKKSMKEKFIINPIMVAIYKGLFVILDGQHRYKACAELGLPVYFFINTEIHEEDLSRTIIKLNQDTVNWKPTDYLHHYVSAKSKQYIEFAKFMESSRPLSLYACIMILKWVGPGVGLYNSGMGAIDRFKNGTFEFTKAERERAEEFILHLLDFKPYTKHWKKRLFIRAFKCFSSAEGYDHEQMVARLKKYAQNTISLGTASFAGFGRMIQNTYNHFTRSSDCVYVDWDKLESQGQGIDEEEEETEEKD